MTEEQRKKFNEERLSLIDPCIRPRVAAVIAHLESQGLRPLIDKDVWRSPAKQLEKFRQGFSDVRWGYHCATTKDGRPGSLAADIVDCEKFWNVPLDWWLRLADAALENGLWSGIFFGLDAKERELLNRAFAANDYTQKVKIGKDPAHVEVRGVSIQEAKAGKRPKT